MTDINFYSAVVKPGDTLVVAMANLQHVKDADEVTAHLEKLLPGIRVVVVAANALAAVRPDDFLEPTPDSARS